MAIHAVVFDLGGVLEVEIDTGLYAKWEARLHLEPGKFREWIFGSGWLIDATYGKFSEEEMLRRFREISGMDQEQMGEFMNDFWDKYCGELNTELAAYFKGLRPRYKTAILTNGVPGARRVERERFDFDSMADLIIYSSEEKTAKPQPRIYEILCERLGLAPVEIVFLDDSSKIVEAARAFGMHAVLFENNAQAISAIQEKLITVE